MGRDIIPSWKHVGCGGSVYSDGEEGFFCKRCEKKLSVPLDKVPRKLLRGTKFETSDAMSRAAAITHLIEAVAIAVEFILSLVAAV